MAIITLPNNFPFFSVTTEKQMIGLERCWAMPTERMLVSSSSFKPTPVPPMQGAHSIITSPPPPPNSFRDFTQWPQTPISIYIYPSGQYVTLPPCSDFETYYNMLHDFMKGFALPLSVNQEYTNIAPDKATILTKDMSSREGIPWRTPVSDAMVLICGHGNRDSRCGVLGPLLQAEFEDKLEKLDIELLRGPPTFHATKAAKMESHAWQAAGGDEALIPKVKDVRGSTVSKQRARVAQISHIGGHKFAGNIIVYIPHDEIWADHPLAGKGIWYGRVEPWHVEGIIEETIKKGNIIKELYRGAVDRLGKGVWVDRFDAGHVGWNGSRSVLAGR